MNRRSFAFLALVAAVACTGHAKELCTVVVDTRLRSAIYWQGSCVSRYTPASTFKIPLALIGFESGYLRSAEDPVLRYEDGDIDWGGTAWRGSISPEQWLRLSVVWYSQRIASSLGQSRIQKYAQAFQYGNADFSGTSTSADALKPAWLNSSLKISPLEQAQFLSRLLNGELPVHDHAIVGVKALLPRHQVSGWTIRGKTGTAVDWDAAVPSEDRRVLGWYVGWAEKDDRTLAFAYLSQDDARQATPAGIQARAHVLQQWPRIAQRLGY